jgi:HJR/Mrr/RecB family endonuclease
MKQLAANEPAVVLVDLSLAGEPEFGCSSINLVAEIRERWTSAPVVAFSLHPTMASEYVKRFEPIIWIDKSAALHRSPANLIKTLQEIATLGQENSLDRDADAQKNDEAISSDVLITLSRIDVLLYKELHRHPELLKSLNWRLFERLLADILETFGYSIELMQGTKDGGIDIVAFGNSSVLGAHKYLLQAKRWKNSVGIEPVQQLLFVASRDRATKACLATTSRFTRGAWRLGQEYMWQLDLKDYAGLQQWIDKALNVKLLGCKEPEAFDDR